MEYIDVLNEKGEKTGVSKPIVEVHGSGLWHRTSHVWFVNNQKEILLQLRWKNSKAYPNKWDISASGHISAGESPEVAATRETKEEIGIDIPLEKLKYIGETKEQRVFREDYINNEFQSIYLVIGDFTRQDFANSEEVQELQFVPFEEFKKWVAEPKVDLVPHPEEYEMLFNEIEKI